jgi:hypothetical protein
MDLGISAFADGGSFGRRDALPFTSIRFGSSSLGELATICSFQLIFE